MGCQLVKSGGPLLMTLLSTIETENMHSARIAELLQPFLSPTKNPCHTEPAKAGEEPAVLSSAQLQSISTYIDILLRWNARVNLTGVRDPEKIVTRHFGESLFAARQAFPSKIVPSKTEPGLRVADLGSGAGFPGIPIKLWAPHIALTLIESNHKKAAFLQEVIRTLTLKDVVVENSRAEILPPSAFDFVTIRAVERFADALPIAADLLSPRGRLVLLISSSQVNTAQASLPALRWKPPIPIPASQSRILLVSTEKS
jgi:16S rRNA (guanine527-N7)-methyltransferase